MIGYSIEDEADTKYRNVVSDEFKWISENPNKITKRARQLYFFKINEAKMKNENNARVYDAISPFKDIEQFICDQKLVE